MTRRRSQRIAVMAVAGLAAAGLAACSSSSTSSAPPSTAGKPVYGGTLRLVASSGPDHVDTVPAYYTADYIMEKAYTRQLLSYPTVPDPTIGDAGWIKQTTPAPDIATEVPTVANGGISNGGKLYTFHIRPGVMWNTTPARQVTADDFIREFKAFCNPAPGGFVGNLPYYASTIAGLQTVCNQETAYFANTKKHPITAANVAAFQNSHTISGITAPDSMTLQFHLTVTASDFLYMLAMPFTSARPVEYDSYLPNSLGLDTHTIADGPYQITSFVPGKSMVLKRNPAWKQSTDPIRHQYVNEITLTDGVTSAQTQLADMQAGKTGTFDASDDTTLQPSSYPALLAAHDPKFKVWPWSSTNPYIVFNLRSPNSNHAMANLKIRQAIEYGVDKVALQKAAGGAIAGQLLNTAIMPGNVGYQPYNLYPDNNGNGDPAKCKAVLASAGIKGPLTLSFTYINDSNGQRNFAAVQASLKLCNINITGKPEPGSSYFVDLGNAPVNNKPGTWDLGFAGWIPDWFGPNGRTIMVPLFDGPCAVNTSNYGCYRSAKLHSLILQAEAATNPAQVASFWHQADLNVVQNAVIVPVLDAYAPNYTSARVQSAGSSAVPWAANIGGIDVTNVWLNPNSP